MSDEAKRIKEIIERIDQINTELETTEPGSDKQLTLLHELSGLESEQTKLSEAPVQQQPQQSAPQPAVTKTHWKKLKNPDFLGSYDFQPGEERIVTVKKVVVESVKNTDGNAGDCTVIHFVENYKPFILNSTNGKTLSKIFDTPYIEEWPGKSFKLVVKPIRAFGEVVDALRVKNEKIAKKLPVINLGTKLFENSKKRYNELNTDTEKADLMNKIKANYTISPEVEKALTDGK